MKKKEKSGNVNAEEPEVSLHSEVDIRAAALRDRISSVIDEAGSRIKAADASGVSADMLAKYASGASRPRFEAIARLCVETGVSLDWVATGEGPRYRQGIDKEGKKPGALHAREEHQQRREDLEQVATDVTDHVVAAFLWLREIAAAERLELHGEPLKTLLRLAVSLPRIPENEAILASVMRQMCR